MDVYVPNNSHVRLPNTTADNSNSNSYTVEQYHGSSNNLFERNKVDGSVMADVKVLQHVPVLQLCQRMRFSRVLAATWPLLVAHAR